MRDEYQVDHLLIDQLEAVYRQFASAIQLDGSQPEKYKVDRTFMQAI